MFHCASKFIFYSHLFSSSVERCIRVIRELKALERVNKVFRHKDTIV